MIVAPSGIADVSNDTIAFTWRFPGLSPARSCPPPTFPTPPRPLPGDDSTTKPSSAPFERKDICRGGVVDVVVVADAVVVVVVVVPRTVDVLVDEDVAVVVVVVVSIVVDVVVVAVVDVVLLEDELVLEVVVVDVSVVDVSVVDVDDVVDVVVLLDRGP